MELSPFCVTILALAIAAAFILRKLKAKSGRVYNLPPGPAPWPVIGNFNLIGALPHRSIHELSKKYGPLLHLLFGSFPVIIGSSVDLARYFLKTHDLLFLDCPKTASGKHTT
jgi:typhasterol/6-deoxotyphasterol 2alpha-hydroxylase